MAAYVHYDVWQICDAQSICHLLLSFHLSSVTDIPMGTDNGRLRPLLTLTSSVFLNFPRQEKVRGGGEEGKEKEREKRFVISFTCYYVIVRFSGCFSVLFLLKVSFNPFNEC